MKIDLNQVLSEEELDHTRKAIILPYNLNVLQIADFFQTSKFTVIRWLKSGELAGYKLGREWRSTRDQVLAYQTRKL